jgi:hypothetical protein
VFEAIAVPREDRAIGQSSRYAGLSVGHTDDVVVRVHASRQIFGEPHS